LGIGRGVMESDALLRIRRWGRILFTCINGIHFYLFK